MNRSPIILGMILAQACSIYAQEENAVPLTEDKLLMAIEASNPIEVRHFVIPGYFIQADQKARYRARAREVSNQTYIDLHSYGLSDIKHVLSGLIKCSAAAFFGFLGYAYHHQSHFRVGTFKRGKKPVICLDTEYTRDPAYVDIADGWLGRRFERIEHYDDDIWHELPQAERTIFYTIVSLCALYSAKQGLSDFWAVIKRVERWKKHSDALVVEALIERLPECTNDVCPELSVTESKSIEENPQY